MTSNSGREGQCERCECANGLHSFGKCQGRIKKGRRWERCPVEWSRCTSGVHPSRYVDCFRCLAHPGAPPEDFWGTQPDDEPQVPTADELNLQIMLRGEVSEREGLFIFKAGKQRFETELFDWEPYRTVSRGSETVCFQCLAHNGATLLAWRVPELVEVFASDGEYTFTTSSDKEIRAQQGAWKLGSIIHGGEMTSCYRYQLGEEEFVAWDLPPLRLYGELLESGDDYVFTADDGSMFRTRKHEWEAVYEQGTMSYFQRSAADGVVFIARMSDARLDYQPEMSKKAKGKRPMLLSHQRSGSADDPDPLSWDPKQIEEEALAFQLSRMAVGDAADSSSSSAMIFVEARVNSKGKVVFQPPNGPEHESSRKKWQPVEGGYAYTSEKLGQTFFATGIRESKKRGHGRR